MMISRRSAWVWLSSVIAVVFGIMTIKSGGSVLFIDGEARREAGNTVDFVLWFNFVAGFFYMAAGFGIWLEKIWAPIMAISIAMLTLFVFGLFGVYILNGGAYEQRTVIAMSLRTTIWIVIALICYRKLMVSDYVHS